MFKKEMICIWRGIHLCAAACSMTLRFTISSSFLSTQNLRIDRNYTLSIFMLVVLCSSISIFNVTRHAYYINIYSCYSFLHAFNFQITYYSTTCIFNAIFHFTTPFMRFKHIHKNPIYTRQCWLFHFDYSNHIFDGFPLMNPALIIIR